MVDSEDRVPDSADLALLQDLVNSSRPDGREELGSTAAASAWLRHRNFAEPTLEQRQLRQLLEARGHLRALFAANAGDPLSAEAADGLQRLLAGVALRAHVDGDGVRLQPAAGGFDGFLATVLASLVERTMDGTLARMKLCRADDCGWTFYDRSKNGSAAWCSMRSCGTRAKARAYRERHRGH